MTSSGQNDFNDFSMLDLFRIEVENGARVLETGLVEVEEQQSPEKMEPLMRAAHSIKGAARIVGLDNAVTLAHSMEDILSSAQNGKIRITSGHVDVLLKCNDIFIRISKLESTDISDHLKKEKATIDSLCKQLSELESSPAVESEVKKQETPASPHTKKHVLFEDTSDYSMFELFRIEVENHCRVIEEGLVEIEKDRSPEKIEPLMRAAHSIKGAARIVNLNLEVSLAHTMEDVFTRTQRGEIELTSKHIDILLSSNDIFLNLSTLDADEVHDWLITQSKKINTLTQSLMDILAGESVEPPVIDTVKGKPAIPGKKDQIQKEESFVRVLAENLSRIMGLTGECLVQAKSSRSFSSSHLHMKTGCLELSSYIESLLQSPQAAFITEEIHTKLNETLNKLDQIHDFLIQHIENYENFSRRLEYLTDQLYGEVVSSRMRPFSDGLHGFPRMIRDLSKKLNKDVSFTILSGSTRVDRDILEKLEAPLTHLIRNALDHGLETPEERIEARKPAKGKIVLEARHSFGLLNITLTDDGRGIDLEKIRRKVVKSGHVTEDIAANLSDTELFDFLFLPTFSTAGKVSEISGRGVGLDVVFSMAHEVGGSIRVESQLGKGTTFHLLLPLTLSVLRTLLIEISGEPYAIPLTRIEHVLEVEQKDLHTIEDRQFCTFQGKHIGIINAQQVLNIPDSQRDSARLYIAVISDRLNQYGLVTDRFLGERDIVVRPLDPRLGKIPNISAGSIMEDGTPILILDVDDLVRSIDNIISHTRPHKMGRKAKQSTSAKKRVLVVDDSLTVRQVERKLLENRGYEVVTAVDGMDGWIALQSDAFDLIITDVDMPRINGIELVKKIKGDTRLKNLPVMIISYKDREEDRLLGLEAGANYYLTKASFHDETLINAVRDLIGEP